MKNILIFLIPLFFYSQKSLKEIFSAENDSIIVQKYYNKTKETSSINSTDKEISILKKEKKISLSIKKKLNMFLKTKKNYSQKTPLISDYDYKILYYKNGEIIQSISYSTFFKKMVIKNEKCNDSDNLNCLYMGRLLLKPSKYFEKLIRL